MITLDNFQKIKQSIPTISQQVDIKATGANVHRIKTELQLLCGSLWFLSRGQDTGYQLTIANQARTYLERCGVHFPI